MPWLKFSQLGKVSPIDIRLRFPDLPPDTSPGGSRSTILCCTTKSISVYSDAEEYLAYHCRFHITVVFAYHSIGKKGISF